MSDENSDLQSWIDPELEARVVAWVLGEASAFEAAELERIVAEKPELGIFKRRIEAVHGLVAAASRLEIEPMRMDAERRRVLIEKLGRKEAGKARAVVAMPIERAQRKRNVSWRMVAGIAGCLVVGVLVIGLALPALNSARSAAIKGPLDAGISQQEVALPMAASMPQAAGVPESDAMAPAATPGPLAALDSLKALASRTTYRNAPAPEAMARALKSVADDQELALAGPIAAPAQVQQEVRVQNGQTAVMGEIQMAPAKKDRAADLSAAAGATDGPEAQAQQQAAGNLQQPVSGLRNAYGSQAPAAAERDEAMPRQAEQQASQQLVEAAKEIPPTGPMTAEASAAGAASAAQPADTVSALNAANTYSGGVSVTAGQMAEHAASMGGGAAGGAAFGGASASYTIPAGAGALALPASVDSAVRFNLGSQTTVAPVIAGGDDKVAMLGDAPELGRRFDDKQRRVSGTAQAETSATDQPYSTFSLHVSDVSFLLARAALERGEMPAPDSIRPEEFYNAFDYGDPAPGAGEKIACRIEQAAHPLLQQRNLVRIAMKVAATGRGQGEPLRLTVLLDTSGSMERDDRAASVKRAMQVLTSLLGPSDAVTLIGFARQPRLLAEEVPGDQAAKLVDIVAHTPPQGGTNLEEALKAASELALRHMQAGGQNRVVLLTDGAANLGDADPARLSKLVDQLRQQGVSFDACGVGADGLNDDILEALTRKGGGRYYLLNTPEDADEGFARQLAGAFRPAAENVKMQVRFNPARVGKYRLIGFEKHRLNQEDFRNDKVTAAQLAAQEGAVALYQVQVLPEGEGEVGEVFVRFRDPADGRMVEQSWTIPYDAQARPLDKASPSMQLAATAALLAEKMRGGAAGDAIDLDALEPVVAQVRGHYASQERVQQLVSMFEQVRRMPARK